jgi:metal-dependent amidase/aminoacylase/carboxypeptidase family protein
MPKGQDAKTTPSHHTPDFFIDESSLKMGVIAMANLVFDYPATLNGGKKK